MGVFGNKSVELSIYEEVNNMSKENKLNELIEYAINHVPYYQQFKNAIENSTSAPMLSHFPVMTKKKMLDHFNDFISDQYKESIIAETEGLHSIKPGQNLSNVLVPEVTSGSSGSPMRCYKTNNERIQLAISAWKYRKLLDPRVSPKNIYCLIHAHSTQKKVVKDTRNFHPDNMKKVLDYLEHEFKPLIIHGTPSDLHKYALYIEENNIKFQDWDISYIESNSELLTEEQKKSISSAFNTRVINNYGALEVWNIAYECSKGHLHISDDIYMEILDPNSNAILPPDSDQYGEILITSLVLKAQPFIRYKIGDIGKVTTKSCECGQTSSILQLHEARTINLINHFYSDKKMVNGVSLFKGVIWDLFDGGNEFVKKYKVIQLEQDYFEVHMVLTNPSEANKLATIDLFKTHAEKRLEQKARFLFHFTDETDEIFTGKNYSFLSRVN